jgi:CRP/FNR family cyclic AMP-dependent transcriptional regulator
MKSRGRDTSGAKGFFDVALPGRKIVKYKAGETIISQGEESSEIYYIEEGVVKLTLVSNHGRAAVLGILGEGDFFGESLLAGQNSYLASAVALVDSTISVIKVKTMQRLIDEDRMLCSRFVDYLLLRNSRIQQNLVDHLFESSEKRLARTLLTLARSGTGVKRPPILEKISQDTLAEMVGTTRSRINFFMNKFRKLGFIHYNGGLKVHNSLAHVLSE